MKAGGAAVVPEPDRIPPEGPTKAGGGGGAAVPELNPPDGPT